MRITELESKQDLAKILAKTNDLTGYQLQAIELNTFADQLSKTKVTGTLFLGCPMSAELANRLRIGGGLIFPQIPELPFDPYRTQLYQPSELYDTPNYVDSLDAQSYAWTKHPKAIDKTLAIALHDHAIDDALAEFLLQHPSVVGIMGGHAATRDSETYALTAKLAHGLAQHHLIGTGGGPGAMEAANLGAWFAAEPAALLAVAIQDLTKVPSFTPDVSAWLSSAHTAKALTSGSPSLGIPTWFYGHEPPNVFATHIAKYFTNSIREQVLLHSCQSGIVFLPGAAGTVQEIFQAACEGYYAKPGLAAPLILFGKEQWEQTLPAWPLLKKLMQSKSAPIHLVADIESTISILT